MLGNAFGPVKTVSTPWIRQPSRGRDADMVFERSARVRRMRFGTW